MRQSTISWQLLAAGVYMLLLSPAVIALDAEHKPEKLVFNLSEISPFEINQPQRSYFVRGQVVPCNEQRPNEIKAYPVFKSDKPLYGSIRLGYEYGEEQHGKEYYFALDEGSGAGHGYDLLYFDINHDLDLTNDTVLKELKNPPDGALLNSSSFKQQVCFDYLGINFDYGTDGQRPLEIMPRLTISDSGYASLGFVTTRAFKGEIEIEGQRYDSLLGHTFQIVGWFDRPSTALLLIPKDSGRRLPGSAGGDRLKAMHKINETYYSFSATPSGDTLSVKPYEGEFGTFRVGSGWRFVSDKGAYGSLSSADASLLIGGVTQRGRSAPVASCELPVGDYLPMYLTIEYKPLRFGISENYYSDGKPMATVDKPLKHCVTIRRNKPFVLDFSNKPQVLFASPAREHKVKLGETLKVEAVLIDPELDIMIRSLERKPYPNILSSSSVLTVLALITPALIWACVRRARKRYRWLPIISASGVVLFVGYTIAMYSVNYRLNYEKLEPHVLITRANGEKLAQGVMPFG